MPHRPASAALARFRVLDLTRVRSGPTCVRQMADWGADVVKIEAPSVVSERDQPGGAREGPDFQNLHRNKRAITLDLKAAEGHALFMRLVESADVVVENFRPDVKDRLKIAYDDLRAVNPRIVLASISGFGQDGPYKSRPGFDQIAQGMGGLMSITGLPGQGPVRVGIPIADLCAGLLTATGILTALLEREASGEGQWVQSSLLQAQVFMLDFQAARWTMEGEVAKQAGNNHPTSIPTGVFKTADGHINIAATGDVIWRRLCDALDLQHLPTDARYADAESRSANRDALNADLEERLKARTSAEWIDALNTAGVPCGRINHIDEVFADPQVQHLGMARSGPSHAKGETDFVSQAIGMSRTPWNVVLPPPEPSEHTDEVLQELGLSANEVNELRTKGVI